VDVEPLARDPEIERRLLSILTATGWFEASRVQVREGVVFLSGTTTSDQFKTWAGDLARRTQDVAAVVNRIEVRAAPAWDLEPAWNELGELSRRSLLALPYILVGAVILTAAWLGAKLITGLARRFLARRLDAPLLREVLARVAGSVLFLLGLFIVLRISGLTRLAVTVLGGTGLLGLIIGIAFRDITENFLASIFLSTQRPFEPGDLVEIAGDLGYVQRLTTRATILMTLDGNHVQIPNATVYKSAIRNFTSNPNRRLSFAVGIGYDDSIAEAQQVALQVLAEHPVVLKDPEPWVLVDSLGSATVNLHIYFWLNGREHSWLKVKSSVIRLVKRAFQAHGISMPDEAREVVFPDGVTVRMAEEKAPRLPERPRAKRAEAEPPTVSTTAEAGLVSDAQEIEVQAARSRAPEEGQDLLKAPGR
jgi:small-conductance mechanosensitive channel